MGKLSLRLGTEYVVGMESVGTVPGQQVPQPQQRRRPQHRAAATAEAAVVAAAAAGLADINDLSLPRAMSHNELLWPYDANSPTVTYQML